MGGPFPPKIALPWWIWTPLNTWFLGPTWILNPNGISIGSAIFAQLMAGFPYTLQWSALCPLIIAHFMGDVDRHLIRFLGRPECLTQIASRLGHPFLQSSLLWQTHRPTDHATQSVTIGCIYYVCITAMQPNNNNKNNVHLHCADLLCVPW